MERFHTGKPSKNLGLLSSTEKPSIGLRYQSIAEKIALSYGYRLLARNFRLKFAEADLVFQKPSGEILLVEVRGSQFDSWIPKDYLSDFKIHRLYRIGEYLARKYNAKVSAEFWQIRGKLPRWKILDCLFRFQIEKLGIF